MAIRYRETRARFRERAKFLGMDTSPLPVVGAAVLSVLLMMLSYSVNPWMNIIVRTLMCGSPLLLTMGYIWSFKTGRRPYLDRDLFLFVMNGKVISPLTPREQPRHPGIPRRSDNRRPKQY